MKNKRIFIYGIGARLCFLLSALFVISLVIWAGIHLSENVLLYLAFALIYLLTSTVWTHVPGIMIRPDKDRMIFMLGYTKKNQHERELSTVQWIDIDRVEGFGFNFIIKHESGYMEKILFRFGRYSFVEEMQYKRIKRELEKFNQGRSDASR